MAQDKIFSALDKLGNFTEEEKEKIAAQAYYVTIPARWAPISQFTAPDRAYLIVEGEARVVKNGEEIATLGSGDLMGEIGLSEKRGRSATVVAKTPLTTLHFTPQAWREVQAIPAFAERVRELVSARS